MDQFKALRLYKRQSVAAYLKHCGIDSTIPDAVTWERYDVAPFTIAETVEIEKLLDSRLEVLRDNLPIIAPNNAQEEKALALLPRDKADAVQAYAKKRGRAYLDYCAHIINHPRGKSAETIAEAHLKIGEATIAIKRIADAAKIADIRRKALLAAACALQF